LCEFRPRGIIDAQQLIQFLSRRLARWINSVIKNTANVATAFQSNVARSNVSHSKA